MPLSPVSKRGELLGTFRSGLGEDGIRQRESIFEQTGNILQASRWLNFGAFFLRNEEQHFIPNLFLRTGVRISGCRKTW